MITWNKLIINFDPDIEEKNGFEIPKLEDAQHHYSIRGTVVEVGELFFNRKKYGRHLSSQELREIRELNELTTSYDCDLELKAGDKVLCSYRARFDDLVRYDLCVARIDGDRLYPLNGFLLIEMLEKDTFEEINGFTVYNEDRNIYGTGIVKYAGKPLRGYADFEHEDDENIVEGMVVKFRKKSAPRMELDFHNSLTDKQSSLFRLHRKDVFMYGFL